MGGVNGLRRLITILLCGCILLFTTGLSCDQNAQADFRAAATEAIGSGLKTIVNGLIDGWVSAILNAGDGAGGATN